MKFGTWLLAMMEPLVAKILVTLGFSVITVTGLEVALNTLKSNLVNSLSLLTPAALEMFMLAGGGQGLGIILGACATKIMLWQITSATKILGVNPQ